MILLLCSVTVSPVTGNFNIPWAVDGIAFILLTPGLPIIPLYRECDLTTMKFIHAEVECSSSPIFTSSDTYPSGHIISPLNPTKYVVAGTIWFLISWRSWLKQCSYRISEEAPPSTYMRWTRCLPTSTSITMGPSVPSSSPKGGNEIIEKLVESSVFGDGSSSGADHTVGGFSSLTGSDFIIGGATRQMSFSAEVKMHAEFNIREKRRLSVVAEATEAIRLHAEFQTLADHNIVLEREKGELDIKVAYLEATVKVHKLEASTAVLQDKVTAYDNFMDLVELALHLEERFYPHLLITIYGRRWLLTHGIEFAIAKYLNSNEYLSSLGATIGKAVEKGMQEGLFAEITHGVAGSVLTDVAAYNLSAEADYLSALQRLQSVNFSLISELKSNKDASIDTIINLLHLEDSLAEKLNLAESQPHVDQLMVPICHSSDQTVVGATSLSRALSIAALEGTTCTSGTAPDTTIALSLTFASTGTISPISTDDYEIVHTDGQEGTNADGQRSTGADANPFPSIDDAELNVPELSFFSLKLFL
ncbi:hypothetical protein Tco_0164245 [Tanacetum coccineum]